MSEKMQIAAIDISSAVLEITGEALLSGSFEDFCSVFHVPQYMATMAGPIYMETEDDMRRAFDEMHNHFKGIQITDLVREVVASKYTSPTRIESTHTTEVLRNGQRLCDPYPVFSILEKIDGTWKVTGSEYALEPTNGQAMAIAKADSKERPNTQDMNQNPPATRRAGS